MIKIKVMDFLQYKWELSPQLILFENMSSRNLKVVIWLIRDAFWDSTHWSSSKEGPTLPLNCCTFHLAKLLHMPVWFDIYHPIFILSLGISTE